jgi:hypothetical protein
LVDNEYVLRANGPVAADRESEALLSHIVGSALSVYWPVLGAVSVDYKGEGETIELAPTVESIEEIDSNHYLARVRSGSGQECRFNLRFNDASVFIISGDACGVLPGDVARVILTDAFREQYPEQPIHAVDFRDNNTNLRFRSARQ